MGYYAGPYHRGIHLPHYDQGHLLHMITYRLGDSLPANALKRLEGELACLPLKEQDVERRKRMEHWLDRGHGSCLLKNPDCARHVKDAWEFHHGKYYDLMAWVVMPNHVHLLVEVGKAFQLEKVVRMWKTFSCRLINRTMGERGLCGCRITLTATSGTTGIFPMPFPTCGRMPGREAFSGTCRKR